MSEIAACWIGLGSNIGDGSQTLRDALKQIAVIPAIDLVRHSSFYKTDPIGVEGQAAYTNAVAEIHTALTPLELLKKLQAVEAAFGRERGPERWQPRTLDIDILLIADNFYFLPDLVVPHPRMHLRAFVLKPLSELAPDLLIPGRGFIKTFLNRVQGRQVVIRSDA